MKPFTKPELFWTAVILITIGLITYKNILVAERRARDAQRQADLGAISDALGAFFADYGYFPPSEDGYIKACRGENYDSVLGRLKSVTTFDRNLYFEGLRKCIWGVDSFTDLSDPSYEPYLKTIPRDPKENLGYRYFYVSNQNRFQLFSALEGKSEEDAFNMVVADRNLPCGSQVCSYGKSYGETPLNKTLEEYEAELLELKNDK